jgi:hypothetical protein
LFLFAVSCWCLNGYFKLHLNQKFLYRLGYAFLAVGAAGMIIGGLKFLNLRNGCRRDIRLCFLAGSGSW